VNPEGADNVETDEKLSSSKKREKRTSRARSTNDPLHNAGNDAEGIDANLGNSRERKHHSVDLDDERKRLARVCNSLYLG
jgi:hypothetical protein